MYKVLGADGQEYGPVNADTLQRWASDGRVNAQTLVRAEGNTDWKPLSAFPEFQATLTAAAVQPGPGIEPAALASRPAATRRQKTDAIWSLGLGLWWLMMLPVGVIMPEAAVAAWYAALFASIAAVATGGVALSQIRRDPTRYGGRGLAWAGLVLGCLGTVWVPLVCLPGKIDGPPAWIRCALQLKTVQSGAFSYAIEHGNGFPPDVLSFSNVFDSPEILVCPASSSRKWAITWTRLSRTRGAYQFLTPGARPEEVLNRPVFRCPIHSNVCYGDGTVLREGVPKPQAPARSP